jgi:hypothetical protein
VWRPAQKGSDTEGTGKAVNAEEKRVGLEGLEPSTKGL